MLTELATNSLLRQSTRSQRKHNFEFIRKEERLGDDPYSVMWEMIHDGIEDNKGFIDRELLEDCMMEADTCVRPGDVGNMINWMVKEGLLIEI